MVANANTGADAIKRAPIVSENTGIRCLRIGDVSQGRPFSEWGFTKTTDDDFNKYQLKAGDTIIARTGNTIGVNTYIDADLQSVYNNGLIRIQVNQDVIRPRYFYYLARSKGCQDFIQSIAFGTSTQPNMKIKDFLQYEFEYFDKDVQDKIIRIIEPIEEKIKLNNEINSNLFEQAKTLYKAWFVDFSRFGNVMPSTCKIGKVEDAIELHDAKRVPLSSNEREKMDKIYPYYGATSLMDYVDNYLFDGIYLLLGEDGTVMDDKGYPVLQYIEGKFWVNNHAHILTGKNGFSVEELYLLFSLTNVKNIVTGAVQQKISQANLKKVEIVIPSADLLKEFDDIIQPLFAEIRNNRNEITKLSSLRDALLPKLMSGEIDLSNIDV